MYCQPFHLLFCRYQATCMIGCVGSVYSWLYRQLFLPQPKQRKREKFFQPGQPAEHGTASWAARWTASLGFERLRTLRQKARPRRSAYSPAAHALGGEPRSAAGCSAPTGSVPTGGASDANFTRGRRRTCSRTRRRTLQVCRRRSSRRRFSSA